MPRNSNGLEYSGIIREGKIVHPGQNIPHKCLNIPHSISFTVVDAGQLC